MRFIALQASILFALGASKVVLAQAQPESPATSAPVPVAGAAAPVEPAAPAPAEAAPPAPPPAAAPASPAPLPAAAPEPVEKPARAFDRERPPVKRRPPERVPGFTARLSLGIAAALWIHPDATKLFLPGTISVDLGYFLNPELALGVRGTTWLKTSDFANEFLGAATTMYFDEQNMYVTAALGVGLTRMGPPSQWKHYVQGVALQADVGQAWHFTDWSEFSIGAQFQLGTPLGGTSPDAFTSVMAGIFVGFGVR